MLQSQSEKAKVAVNTCNPNTKEATARRSQAQGLPGQLSKNVPQHKR